MVRAEIGSYVITGGNVGVVGGTTLVADRGDGSAMVSIDWLNRPQRLDIDLSW